MADENMCAIVIANGRARMGTLVQSSPLCKVGDLINFPNASNIDGM